MHRRIAKTAVIYPGVKLGKDVEIEDFCIIGCPSRGMKVGELETVVGDGSYIRSHTVVYFGNRIGRNFQTGNKANIRESNDIGDDVSVGTMTVIEHHVKIGNGVRIHSHCFIPEYTRLDDESWIGPKVVMTNTKYPLSINAKSTFKGPHIKRGAIIGANATILPAVVIGKHALVGAASVVTEDVESEAVVVGNPARRIGSIRQLPYEL